MFFRGLGATLFILLFSVQAFSQALIVQWTDVHSTLKTLSQQTLAIDRSAREFLSRHPRGEVIIYIIGDFTSIDPYNIKEGGWLAHEAIKLLRERGYTVLFTPGNHDAFDWTVRIDGPQLFIEQMKALYTHGVKILVQNLRGKTAEFAKIVSNSYRLRTVRPNTHLVGLTIPAIISKSNLTEDSARQVFNKIENYETSVQRILPSLEQQGVERVFWGVHQGHVKLQKQVLRLIKEAEQQMDLKIRSPLLMGAHDHQVAMYHARGSIITDAGSHGSFNTIEIDKNGEVVLNRMYHTAISQDSFDLIKPYSFQIGRKSVNPVTEVEILSETWLEPYHTRVHNQLNTAEKRMGRVMGITNGVDLHKAHLKQGPNTLGILLSESLVAWAKQVGITRQMESPFIAMTNSSSYRLEAPIPPGEMTELTFRMMYPFNNESTLYHLTGDEVTRLYFSLRRSYSAGDPTQHSPHLNADTEERNNELYIRDADKQWHPIQAQEKYWVVMDGWLSNHRYEQSYRIPEWIEILTFHRPKATRPYQDILVNFLPPLIEVHEGRSWAQIRCEVLFRH